MTIHFPNSPLRRIAVYEDKARVIRQLCLGSIESVIKTLLQNKEWQSIVYYKVSNLITTELTGLCPIRAIPVTAESKRRPCQSEME